MKLSPKKARPARTATRRSATKPAVTLRAEVGRVKTHGMISVKVAFRGAERVELSLEPARTFALDTRTLKKAGIVRLRGERDGKATLIARARAGEREVARALLHVECEGPVVRILGFGYTPAE
jgi:hypothetical protein